MRAEIYKRVYEKYPVTKKERECQREKKIRGELRELYRKRLMVEEKEKKEYESNTTD